MILSYPASLWQKLYVIVLGPLLILVIMYAAYAWYPSISAPSGSPATFSIMVFAAAYTFVRLAVAYALAVVVAIPLAFLALTNRTVESILLPIFDVLESIPILAIFPFIVVIFIRFGFIEGAAIFILFINMLWNIVFALVGGLKIIPKDINYAAAVYKLTGFAYVRRIAIPAIFPELITGSILAVAEGWNLIIVAEALHAYIPGGTPAHDLFGIGSILVNAAAHAQNSTFLLSVFVLVGVIALLNFFVWQKLLHYAQRFRFD